MTTRIAILTCGTIARKGHLPAFKVAGADVVDVVAFTSRTRASAEAAASEWGSGDVVDDWRAVLDRDDVDAVDICSPNSMHAEMAIASARAGKHVLVEKPMATSLAEADAMIDAAEAAGVVLMTAHNVRFAPPYMVAAAAIADGLLGDVVGVRAAFGHGGPHGWAPDAAWFYDASVSGGGALIDLGIHVADLIRAVTGDEVDEVSALLRPAADYDGIDEAAQVAFRLRGGGLGTFHASWVARPGPDHQLSVFGSEGSLALERGMPVVRRADGSKPELPEVAAVNPYAAFADACATGTPPPVSGVDGREALAIVLAAYESAAGGATIRVAHRQ